MSLLLLLFLLIVLFKLLLRDFENDYYGFIPYSFCIPRFNYLYLRLWISLSNLLIKSSIDLFYPELLFGRSILFCLIFYYYIASVFIFFVWKLIKFDLLATSLARRNALLEMNGLPTFRCLFLLCSIFFISYGTWGYFTSGYFLSSPFYSWITSYINYYGIQIKYEAIDLF